MQIRKGFMCLFPHDLIQTICNFLKIWEINELAKTCKELYDNFYVHIKCQQFKHMICGKSNSNILYCNSKFNSSLIFNQILSELRLIKFFISSKDQGWVSDCQSGSWIQCEFRSKDKKEEEENNSSSQMRIPLIYNYEVRDFATKEKILSNPNLCLHNSNLDIYLRCQGQGWQIACNNISIFYVYSHRLCLKQRQLMKDPGLLKKKKKLVSLRKNILSDHQN